MPRAVFLRRINPSSVSRSLGDSWILGAVDLLAIVFASSKFDEHNPTRVPGNFQLRTLAQVPQLERSAA